MLRVSLSKLGWAGSMAGLLLFFFPLDQQHAGRRVSGMFVKVITYQLLFCGLGRQHGWAAAVLLPYPVDQQHAGRRVSGAFVTANG
jgi:hypothetical protein